MKKFIFIAIITLGVNFSACQKEKEIFPNQSEMTTTPPPDQGDTTTSDQGDTKAGNNTWIMNASSANDIPSQMFSVASKYKISYQHKKMNYINGFGKCSWTSYVIASACIIKGNWSWYSYPVNNTKVDQVMNACVQNQGGSYLGGAAITTLKWYCNDQDYAKLSCYQKSTSNSSSGRFTAIKYMLDHLYAQHSPFLVIGTSGTKGHYLVVHAINWKRGGTGSTVYYTDCLYMGNSSSYNDNIKTMDFTSFLNKMVGAPTSYNMLFLWPNAY